MISYEFDIVARCPVDDTCDVYEARLDTHTMVDVESILAVVATYAHRAIFQEHLTAELQARFGGVLTTSGYHSGVKVTVTAGEA